VVHARDGQGEAALVGLLTGDGARCFARITDAADLATLLGTEADEVRVARVADDGTARLAI
jgi:hypothetical protein